MAGERAEAVADFGSIVAELEPLQDDYDREPLLSLQRRTGGVLAAISARNHGERTDEELTELAGLCSNLDPFETEASVAPPLDALRMDLIKLELAYGVSLDSSLREAPKLRASKIMSFRVATGTLLFLLAQRTLDFSDIVADGFRQLDAIAMLKETTQLDDPGVMREYDGKSRIWSAGSDELLVGNMIVAVFGLAAANQLDRIPLARWRSDGAAHPQGGRVVQLTDHLEGLFVTGTIDAWSTVLTPLTSDWAAHAASSLAATLLKRLAPDALLVSQALWVHYLQQPHLASLVARYLDYLVTSQWNVCIATPQLFELGTPSLAPLAKALADPAEGWAKIRCILQAALSVVPLASDENARTTIEAMQD